MNPSIVSGRGLLCALCMLSVIAGSACKERRVRNDVQRVRTDMRVLAVAIEGYVVDHMLYPAYTTGPMSINAVLGQSKAAMDMPSFQLADYTRPGPQIDTLTTPDSYIPSYPQDPFALPSKATYVFWFTFPDARNPGGGKTRRLWLDPRLPGAGRRL